MTLETSNPLEYMEELIKDIDFFKKHGVDGWIEAVWTELSRVKVKTAVEMCESELHFFMRVYKGMAFQLECEQRLHRLNKAIEKGKDALGVQTESKESLGVKG